MAEGILDADRDNVGTPGAAQRASALVWIAEAQAEAGNMDGARRTIVAAVAAAERIPEVAAADRISMDWRASVFGSIAEAQAGAGDVDGAFRTAERIPSYEYDALDGIALGQAKSGDVEGALLTADRISNGLIRARIFEQIAVTQAEAGDAEGARPTLQAAVTTAERIPLSLGIQGFVLENIALAQAKAGEVEGALRTAERVPEANGRAKALARIAIALVQADRAAGRRPAAK